MKSAWNSAPIAAPWRQGLCGSLAAVIAVAVMSLPTFFARPDSTSEAVEAVESRDSHDGTRDARQARSRSAVEMVSVPPAMSAFTAARAETRSLILPATSPAVSADAVVSPTSYRMADGDAFPLVITIPAGPAWRDVFRMYGGAIGVSNSSSSRPAYLNHTITPDGRLDEESIPTTGRFLFRLSDEAIRLVNETVEPSAQITAGQSAFGVFAAPFRSVVARVLQEYCTTEHVSPDDLAVVQLELGPGFGLRVASTTRRAKRF